MRATEVEMLFQRLRSLRKQLADEQGLAPYMVFADSTLKSMAQQRQTLVEFSKISGVGSHKLSTVGASSLKFRLTARARAVCNKCLNFYYSLSLRNAVAHPTVTAGLSVEKLPKTWFSVSTIITHLLS